MRLNTLTFMLALLLPVFFLPEGLAQATDPATSPDASEVVLRLGDQELTLAEFEERYRFYLFNLAAERGLPLDEETIPTLAELRPVYLDQLATERVVLSLGRSLGAQVPEGFVDEQLEAIRENLGETSFEESLSEAGLASEDLLRTLIAEAELSRQTVAALRENLSVPDYLVELSYANRRDEFVQDGEVCAKHILVETLAEAEQALADIAGSSFEDVATQTSQDPGSAVNGGDLGCFPRGATVPAFDEAAANAPLNEITEPVQTDFGFHLILPYERNEGTVLELSEVAPALRQELGDTVVRLAIEGYTENVGVEIFEEVIQGSEQ